MRSSAAPEIAVVRRADAAHPRHSEPAVLERRDGSLFLIWQQFCAGHAGGGEDNAPGRLAAAVSHDGGRSWNEERVVVEREPGEVNVYSPNLVALPDGDWLLVYFRYQRLAAGQPPATIALACRSTDEGATFGPPWPLWEGQPLHFASGVLKRLPSGRLVLPAGRQMGATWSPTDHERQGCYTSDDDGRTWQPSETWVDLPLRGAMEGHVETCRDGSLLMVLRTQLGAVFQTTSADGGRTWSKPQTTGLRAPESCPELLRIPPTGDLLLVWNHSEYNPAFGSHYGKRSPLSVAVSRDDGRTWPIVRDIETAPARAFSNPVACVTRAGRVLLFYWTCPYHTDRWHMDVRRLDLRVALFDLAWLYA